MSNLRSFASLAALALAGCSEYDLTGQGDDNGLPDDTDVTGVDPDDVPHGEGAVEGRICAPDDATWVAGATVWIEFDDGTRETAITDGDGHFLLEGLPSGTFTVYVEKGSFHTEFVAVVTDGEITTLATQECLSGDDVNIAVVTGLYDSIQVVLDRLNLHYTVINGIDGNAHVNLLRDPAQLEQYDIIFFNCGMNDNWLPYRPQIASNIKDYVHNGGSVYTSDWSYYLAETAYPDLIEFKGDDNTPGAAKLGVAGSVHGVVLDADMISALGTDQADLWYDLDIWITPDSVGNGTELIRGSYDYYDDPYSYYYTTLSGSGPLAARRIDGDGELIYTSFHNERQTTAEMDVLLQEIILSM
jgi:hypothetical protein